MFVNAQVSLKSMVLVQVSNRSIPEAEPTIHMYMLFPSTVRMLLWQVYTALLVVYLPLALDIRAWVNLASLFPLIQATEGPRVAGWGSPHLQFLQMEALRVYQEVE